MSRTFRSLRYRNARLFFSGLLVSNIGTWMQATATAWLVFELSGGEGMALGIVTALQFLPMLLLGAWAGALADQHNRRHLAMITQVALAVQAIVLGLVDLAGWATLPIVYLLSLVLGVASAIDNPARRSLVTELVPEDELTNAISLNTAVMTGSRILGPALAGLLVASIGTGWCFIINGVSFVAVLLALAAMRPSEMRMAPKVARGGNPVRDGFKFIWTNRLLRLVFLVLVIVSTFSFNYQVSLPLIVGNNLGGGAAAFGWILAVSGLGSFFGSLLVAGRSTVTLPWYLGGVVMLGASSIALALSPTVWIAMLFAVPMGVGGAVFIASGNAITQPVTPPNMRGRVLAISAVAFLGSTPIGSPITGWVGDTFGATWSLAYGGLIALVTAGVATVLWLRARQTDPSVTAAIAD